MRKHTDRRDYLGNMKVYRSTKEGCGLLEILKTIKKFVRFKAKS